MLTNVTSSNSGVGTSSISSDGEAFAQELARALAQAGSPQLSRNSSAGGSNIWSAKDGILVLEAKLPSGRVFPATYTFIGDPSDYTIENITRPGQAVGQYRITRRINDGYDPSKPIGDAPQERFSTIIRGNVQLAFQNRNPSGSPSSFTFLPNLDDMALLSRNIAGHSLSLSGSFPKVFNPFGGSPAQDSNSVYYKFESSKIESVVAGSGNDMLRVAAGLVSKSEGGTEYSDFFNGGDGLDTVYLPGKRTRYTFLNSTETNELTKSPIHKIYDSVTGGTLLVSNVERIGFDGETKRSLRFANLKDLLPRTL